MLLFSRIVHIKAFSFQGFPITYELSSTAGKPQNNYAINPRTGVVDLLRRLDYESDPSQYHLKVKAIENGEVPRSSTVNVSSFMMLKILVKLQKWCI